MFDKLFNLRVFIIDLSNYLSLELVKHYLFRGLKLTSIILLFMENKQSNPIQLQVSWYYICNTPNCVDLIELDCLSVCFVDMH